MSTSTIDQKFIFTLASLNLWCFYDWGIRLPVIVKLLKKVQPDILFTQETQRNIATDPRSQIEIINAELGYPYFIFAPADIKLKQKGEVYEFLVEHGLGILSKWPITTETIQLVKAQDDKEKRITLLCMVDINNTKHTLLNLHFSNSNIWAENHFKETLQILNQKNLNPIWAGDFNIYDIVKYKDLYGDRYTSSSEQYDYISYPNDNAPLDYVLLPRRYEFENFECYPEYISDHRIIVARIKAK